MRAGRFELTGLPPGEIALRASTEDGGLAILRGVQVAHGADMPDVTARLHRAVALIVRYVGDSEHDLGIQAVQDGVVVTWVTTRQGETATFWAMPGPIVLRVTNGGEAIEEIRVDLVEGIQDDVVLPQDNRRLDPAIRGTFRARAVHKLDRALRSMR